jgi:hypothetical protein
MRGDAASSSQSLVVCLPPNVPFTFLMMNESSQVTIHDAVLHPQHYTKGAVECIDAIHAAIPLSRHH